MGFGPPQPPPPPRRRGWSHDRSPAVRSGPRRASQRPADRALWPRAAAPPHLWRRNSSALRGGGGGGGHTDCQPARVSAHTGMPWTGAALALACALFGRAVGGSIQSQRSHAWPFLSPLHSPPSLSPSLTLLLSYSLSLLFSLSLSLSLSISFSLSRRGRYSSRRGCCARRSRPPCSPPTSPLRCVCV